MREANRLAQSLLVSHLARQGQHKHHQIVAACIEQCLVTLEKEASCCCNFCASFQAGICSLSIDSRVAGAETEPDSRRLISRRR